MKAATPKSSTDAILAQLWQRLATAEACWFASVRPDGRAHSAPIWHVCYAEEIYVVTQPQSVRARNIAQNPAVSISLPDPMNVLIVEGQARFAPETRTALRPLFQKKYGWDIGNDMSYTAIVAVAPRKMMAWGGEAGEFRRTFPAPDNKTDPKMGPEIDPMDGAT